MEEAPPERYGTGLAVHLRTWHPQVLRRGGEAARVPASEVGMAPTTKWPAVSRECLMARCDLDTFEG